MVPSRTIRKIGLEIAVAGAILVVIGCGSSDGLDRVPIHGQIQGAVGRNGSITLIPDAGSDAPVATAPILDGAYRFDKTNGPVPGEYEAIIALKGSAESEPTDVSTPGQDDKTVEYTRRRGRTFASFDVQVDEKRVKLSVSEKEPLEINIDLP
jgi:hypothetical protein